MNPITNKWCTKCVTKLTSHLKCNILFEKPICPFKNPPPKKKLLKKVVAHASKVTKLQLGSPPASKLPRGLGGAAGAFL